MWIPWSCLNVYSCRMFISIHLCRTGCDTEMNVCLLPPLRPMSSFRLLLLWSRRSSGCLFYILTHLKVRLASAYISFCLQADCSITTFRKAAGCRYELSTIARSSGFMSNAFSTRVLPRKPTSIHCLDSRPQWRTSSIPSTRVLLLCRVAKR